MKQELESKYTKYEIARVIGARSLQIAMDAPLLIKISDEELKNMRFDAIKIAEKEFEEGVLPIAINRPMPQKKKEKISAAREKELSDEELEKKAKEVEKEIKENIEEYSSVQEEAEEVEEAALASRETAEEA